MTDEQVASLGAAVGARLDVAIDVLPAPRLEDVRLPSPRVDPPAANPPSARTTATATATAPRPARSDCSDCATKTSTKVAASRTAETALISGVTPVRTIE